MKKCIDCNEEKSFDQFYKRSDSSDGYRNQCISCKRTKNNKWNSENKDKRSLQMKLYGERNKEIIKVKNKEYRESNKESFQQRDKEYYLANKEKMIESSRRNYYKNHELSKKKRREYQRENLHIFRESSHRRRARIRNQFISPVNEFEIYKRDGGICQICGKNVKRKEISIDHITPISKGGAHAPWNVQLAHLICNKRRGVDRIPAQLKLPF